MSQRTRAWQFLLGASLLLGSGCKTTAGDEIKDKVCGVNTPCPLGYKCAYEDGINPSNPQSLGKCAYVECELMDPCKKPHKQCALPDETAMCDRETNDKYCECVRPSSQELPNTPTTGAPPTTGVKP
jgi:hypothetical protein